MGKPYVISVPGTMRERRGVTKHSNGRYYKAASWLPIKLQADKEYEVVLGERTGKGDGDKVKVKGAEVDDIPQSLDGYWGYESIDGHDSRDPNYLRVYWGRYTHTKVDVYKLIEDDPQGVCDYILKKRLHRVKAWKKVCKVLNGVMPGCFNKKK